MTNIPIPAILRTIYINIHELEYTVTMTSRLASARYGKENVRVYKVHRDEASGTQTVFEMTVSVLLEGEIDVSYVLTIVPTPCFLL